MPHLEHLDIRFSGQAFDQFEYRSEDLGISPSGSQVAVITTLGKILLFEIDVGARPVHAELLTALASEDLQMPHGIDWVDDEYLVVANRRSGISFFRVPRHNRWERDTRISVVSAVQSRWFGAPGECRMLRNRPVVTGAGSVRVFNEHLYVASNKENTITRHRLTAGPSCAEGEVVAQEGIEIPDSAVVSPDGVWLAVGDHDHNRVLVFRLGQTKPVAQLTDKEMLHPHGVAFDPTGNVLISTDAGGCRLHVFHAPDGSWDKDQSAAISYVEGVAARVFERVQAETPEAVRALEGGTKGIDLSRDGNTVLTTCRGQTLRAFALHV